MDRNRDSSCSGVAVFSGRAMVLALSLSDRGVKTIKTSAFGNYVADIHPFIQQISRNVYYIVDT